MDCQLYPLTPPKIVAFAKDVGLTATAAVNPFPDGLNLPGPPVPKYGQDLTFGKGRAAPGKQDVGATEADLKPKMSKLIDTFASNDKSGMAKRLFANFLAKRGAVTYFDDLPMSTAALTRPNILSFLNAAVSAPGLPNQSAGKVRIHQALKKANWDIAKMVAPTDLGVPAFNDGNKVRGTGDFGNGLGVMINGVQYVYVIATHYHYDKAKARYCLHLKYIFYDVFGLDDDDLREYGSGSDGLFSSSAGVGITAWWQLQHQHAYAPLVTRIVVTKAFDVPAV